MKYVKKDIDGYFYLKDNGFSDLKYNEFILCFNESEGDPERQVFLCCVCGKVLKSVDNTISHWKTAKHKREAGVTTNKLKYLRSIPNINKTQESLLSDCLNSIESSIFLSKDDLSQRQNVCTDVETTFTKAGFKALFCKLYGCSVLGVGLKDTEVEIELNYDLSKFQDIDSPETFYLELVKVLRKSGLFCDVIDNFHLHDSSLSFTHVETGLKCLIRPNHKNRLHLNKLITQYIRIDKRVPELCNLFMYWARLCGLDDPSSGGIDSNCFVLMVLHFLQQLQSPVIPVIKTQKPDCIVDVERETQCTITTHEIPHWKSTNEMSIGQLWIALFRYYLLTFHVEAQIVSIQQVTPMARFLGAYGKKKIVIQDPFNVGDNLAKSIGSSKMMSYFKKCLEKTYTYFSCCHGPPVGKSKTEKKVNKTKCNTNENKQEEESTNNNDNESDVYSDSDVIIESETDEDHDATATKNESHSEMEVEQDIGYHNQDNDDINADQHIEQSENSPREEVSHLPLAEISDLPRVELSDVPRAEVSDLPRVEVLGSPGAEMSDSLRAELSDSQQTEKSDSPGAETSDSPRAEVSDSPRTEMLDLLRAEPSGSTRTGVFDSQRAEMSDSSRAELSDDSQHTEKSDSPGAEMSDSLRAEVSDSQQTEKSDSPGAETSNLPRTKMSDLPGAEVSDSPQAEVSDSVEKVKNTSNTVTEDNKGLTKFNKHDIGVVLDNLGRTVDELTTKMDESTLRDDDSSNFEASHLEESPVKNALEKFQFICKNLKPEKTEPPIFCWECLGEGHNYLLCPSKCFVLESLKAGKVEWTKHLDAVCLNVMNSSELHVKDKELRIKLLKGVEDLLKEDLRDDCRLALFGSSVNGFGLKGSDLDICLRFREDEQPNNVNSAELVVKISKILRRQPDFHKVMHIKSAKVPIVKFEMNYQSRRFEGDISLYNCLALRNSQLLLTYSRIDERFRILGYCIKHVAKLCEIGDASRGSLSSYAYILMALYYLQHTKPPVLPVLQELYPVDKKKPKRLIEGKNTWFYDDLKRLPEAWPGYNQNKQSVGELWIGLFRFYLEEFDFRKHVIAVKQTRLLTKFQKLWTGFSIAIEDPFNVKHNLGAGIRPNMFKYIMTCFVNARSWFGNQPTIDLKSKDVKKLEAYFFDRKILTGEKEVPKDRLCRRCGKIGHRETNCAESAAVNRDRRRRRDSEKLQSELNGVPVTNDGTPKNERTPRKERHRGQEITCYSCNEPGHIKSNCPKKKENIKEKLLNAPAREKKKRNEKTQLEATTPDSDRKRNESLKPLTRLPEGKRDTLDRKMNLDTSHDRLSSSIELGIPVERVEVDEDIPTPPQNKLLNQKKLQQVNTMTSSSTNEVVDNVLERQMKSPPHGLYQNREKKSTSKQDLPTSRAFEPVMSVKEVNDLFEFHTASSGDPSFMKSHKSTSQYSLNQSDSKIRTQSDSPMIGLDKQQKFNFGTFAKDFEQVNTPESKQGSTFQTVNSPNRKNVSLSSLQQRKKCEQKNPVQKQQQHLKQRHQPNQQQQEKQEKVKENQQLSTNQQTNERKQQQPPSKQESKKKTERNQVPLKQTKPGVPQQEQLLEKPKEKKVSRQKSEKQR